MTTNIFQVALAGSTQHSLTCAQSLASHKQFQIVWLLTPKPKPVGRQKTINKNPIHRWAEKKQLPVIAVSKKLDQQTKQQINAAQQKLKINQPDFLLTVDFGYRIPNWLLQLPKIAPLNIHPSALPRWRGSSPGQFVLLKGETESAVTVFKLTDKLDAGPIIYQEKFSVQSHWTQTEYYQHSFKLIASKLPQILIDYAQGSIKEKPQPTKSPTPIAKQLTKQAGFIPWKKILNAQKITAIKPNSQAKAQTNLAQKIERSCRAFYPWPGLWTIIPTKKGPKRMKILKCNIDHGKLKLTQVQVAGQKPARFTEIKTLLV
ncbi:MAG: hypothetical protein GF390_04050 [Candidatus Pacebacteria bacterium]|nr:hypothetical protein [Candidatus Paceibacterota bacterium]